MAEQSGTSRVPTSSPQPGATTTTKIGNPPSTAVKPVRPAKPANPQRVTGSTTVRRPTRKARLRVARVDPWSVAKTSLLFSIAAAIVGIVAVALLWSIIEASGAIDMMQEALNALIGNADGSGRIQIRDYLDRWRVLGFTALVSAINVVLLTALATLSAFLYNLACTLWGGLEVTLSED